MRDIAVSLIVFGSLPIILVRPYVGLLMFAWLGYMNPHRLSWGFAHDFPFAYVVAITTLVGMLFSSEPKRVPATRLTVVWLLFIAWMGITTMFAFYPDAALLQYEKVLKIQLMSFAIIVLVTTRKRMLGLIWVIVLSLGYYGVKGGVFTILIGGVSRVWGPEGSFIDGNNEIAIALLMTLPMMYFLRTVSHARWVRLGLLGAMILCAFSVVGTQSRGALLGGLAMAGFLWIKSRHKVWTGVALLVLIPALFAFMPEQWHERMSTIETYQADSSAMGRINVWRMALNIANDNPIGGGFELWTRETFDRYSPEKVETHDGHSIYFKVLAEHGWLGLVLFLGIGLLAWRTCSSIVRTVRGRKDLQWFSELARMLQVSVVAYAVGGAFLGLSYFDLYWNIVAIIVTSKVMLDKRIAESNQAAVAGSALGFADGVTAR
jgi:probable O-glycosylation ligase (exosortase A-associated)